MDGDQNSYGKGEGLMGAARPYLSQGGIDRRMADDERVMMDGWSWNCEPRRQVSDDQKSKQ